MKLIKDGNGKQKNDDSGGDFKIGYGRPPVRHQFKKGQSGNPAGSKRTRGVHHSRNLKAELLDELGHKVPVTENGQRRRLPKQTIFIKKLMADAMNGNPKARDQLLRLASQPDHGSDVEAEDFIGAARDLEIIELFRDEIIKGIKGSKK